MKFLSEGIKRHILGYNTYQIVSLSDMIIDMGERIAK